MHKPRRCFLAAAHPFLAILGGLRTVLPMRIGSNSSSVSGYVFNYCTMLRVASRQLVRLTLLTARVPHMWQPSPSCAFSFSTKPSLAHCEICCGSVKPQPLLLYADRTCTHICSEHWPLLPCSSFASQIFRKIHVVALHLPVPHASQ